MSQPKENAKRMLLHACCGPCSLEPVRVLRERGLSPDIFYANSNIAPTDEYRRRLDTLRTWAASEGVSVAEGSYRPDLWRERVGRPWQEALKDGMATECAGSKGEPGNGNEASIATAGCATMDANVPTVAGATATASNPERVHGDGKDSRTNPADADDALRRERCRACYRLRFEEAATWAVDHGYEALGTTLSVSPYQYTDVIREELERACEEHGLEAMFEDWRPYYDNATRRSREAGMYRQNYCGCALSAAEAEAERAERKAAREAARKAKAEARAAEEAELARRREERRVYDQERSRRKTVLRQLRESRQSE